MASPGRGDVVADVVVDDNRREEEEEDQEARIPRVETVADDIESCERDSTEQNSNDDDEDKKAVDGTAGSENDDGSRDGDCHGREESSSSSSQLTDASVHKEAANGVGFRTDQESQQQQQQQQQQHSDVVPFQDMLKKEIGGTSWRVVDDDDDDDDDENDDVDEGEKDDELRPMRSMEVADKDDDDHDDFDDVDLEKGGRRRSPTRRFHHHHLSANIFEMQHRRMSNVTDLATGKKGGARAHKALVRSERSRLPTSAAARRRRDYLRWMTGGRAADADAGGAGGDGRSPSQEFGEDNANSSDDDGPNGGGQRQLSKHGNFMISSLNVKSGSGGGGKEDVTASTRHLYPPQTQFRLQAVKPPSPRNRFLRWLGCSDNNGTVSIYDDVDSSFGSTWCKLCCCGFSSPNAMVIRYLNWAFRSSFYALFLSAAVGFFGLTLLFAIPIWGIIEKRPTCVGGIDSETNYFTDAYMLSWTTFSTVGYGLVYSGISSTEPDVHKCTGITIIVTLEAFVGVLFASFCGAILFAKVTRIQSIAQVTFSDPLVLRYGTGVAVEHQQNGCGDTTSDDGSVGAHMAELESFPCPVLEFRIVNSLSQIAGGEIIDASLQIVAAIDAAQASPALRGAAHRRRRGGKKGKKRAPRGRTGGSLIQRRRGSGDNSRAGRKRTKGMSPERRKLLNSLKAITTSATSTGEGTTQSSSERTTDHPPTPQQHHQEIEEKDPTGHLVPRKIFSKLEVESPEHPFFRRVWVVRHVLDQHSPLLRHHARLLLKRNGGRWPRELCHYQGVRAAIHFDQILVSMSGTSNADANSVYATKMYEFVDLNIGYRFVNMLYRDHVDGSLRVDGRLINDVTEQAGGGGEPFLNVERDNIKDMAVW